MAEKCFDLAAAPLEVFMSWKAPKIIKAVLLLPATLVVMVAWMFPLCIAGVVVGIWEAL